MSNEEYLRLARIASQGDATDLLMFADLMEEKGDVRAECVRRHAACACNRSRFLVGYCANDPVLDGEPTADYYRSPAINDCYS